jgi:ABC-type Fe3+/spermidine/putrescine transport system ATPase subunit
VSDVRVERLTKVYGTTLAVDGLTLAVPEGTLLTLFGPSGCGKSTVLRMIAGLTPASSGRVLIDGRDVTDWPANRRGVSMVFQDYALFPHMSVRQNVAFGVRVQGVPEPAARERVNAVLDMVGLMDLEQRYPGELSGGQQQRVALARGLAVQPKVLLLDEPLSSLDAKLREQTRREIRALQKQLKVTAIYVTHDLEEALVLSDTVAVMRAGCLQEIGTPWEIYDRPRSLFGAQFLGHANLFPGTYAPSGGTDTCLEVRGGLRIKSSEKIVGIQAGDRLTALVRPERIELVETSGGEPYNSVAGCVRDVMLLGSICRIFVEAVPLSLEVVVDVLATRDERRFVSGKSVTLRWSPDDVRLIAKPGEAE